MQDIKSVHVPLDSVVQGVDRRKFLKAGVGATLFGLTGFSLGTIASSGTRAAVLRASSTVDSLHAVVDTRFAVARTFGARLPTHKIERHLIEGDVTKLWISALRPAVETSRPVVFGLTTPSTLFGLEQLASSYRMRLVARIDVETGMSYTGGREIPAAFSSIVGELLDGETSDASRAGQVHTSKRFHGESDCLVAWVISPTEASLMRL